MQNLSQTYQHYKTSSMSFLYSIATGLGLFQLTETALLSLVGLIVSAFSSIVVQALRNRAETNMRKSQGPEKRTRSNGRRVERIAERPQDRSGSEGPKYQGAERAQRSLIMTIVILGIGVSFYFVVTQYRLRQLSEQLKTFGENGYKYVKENFDREKLADRYIELIKKVSNV